MIRLLIHMSADDTQTTRSEQDAQTGGAVDQGPKGRDVVVPMRVYKLVTVVTTLVAVPLVVVGFMFLDAATLQVSFMRGIVETVLTALGLAIADGVLRGGLAVIGLSIIGVGAVVYVVGARFRAEGMGNAEEDADEDSRNG